MSTTTILFGLAIPLSLVGLLSACGGSSCPEGAYKNAESGICIKLPADFKADDKIQKVGDSSSLRVANTKSFKSFTIWIDKPDNLDQRAKIVANMAGSDLKLVESGDTSPSKGKFFHFHNAKGDYEFAVALVPGKDHFYRCEIQNTPAADAKPMIEACKTLSGP